MEEHKALKYCDYRDKLYMIIGIENFDDTQIIHIQLGY